MRSPLVSMVFEYAALPRITASDNVRSRPNDPAKARPSASAARFRPSTRLVTSFIFAPVPAGPVWNVCRPIDSKMSADAANDSASPPTISVTEPARTCALLPEMVASRYADPAIGQAPRQLLGAGRIAGGRVDDREPAAQGRAGGLDHVGDFTMARQAQQHSPTAGKYLLRIFRDVTASLAERCHAPGIDVPAHHALPRREQPLRQRAANQTKANQADRRLHAAHSRPD